MTKRKRIIDDPYAHRTCKSFEPTPDAPEFCAVCGWQRIDHAKATLSPSRALDGQRA